MKTLYLSAIASVMASPLLAQGKCEIDAFGQDCPAVPEISALEGTAALAVLAAVVLLAWERRRRAV